MSLIGLLIAIVVFGAIVYIISIMPLPHPWKTIAMVLVAVIAIVYLLQLLPGMGALRID